MPRRSIKEIKQTHADYTYWQEIEKVLPWKIFGFTRRKDAAFLTNARDVLTISGEQRDQILQAMSGKTRGK